MSNEFVMVPREWAELLVEAGAGEAITRAELQVLRDALVQPAEQHQGEPVAWLWEHVNGLRICTTSERTPFTNEHAIPPNCKKTPLYTHADPGEVTLDQVLRAYEYADSHPHKYLRGTTNWCAAVTWHLNKNRSAKSGE